MGVVENPAAPGTPSSPVTADWLSPEAAVRTYVRYEARYRARYGREYARRGRTPDCRLAWHAAFPLYLTAELLNLIHANFLGGEGIPWHAEADFLLSPLCRPAGPGLYRVDPVVREVLLLELVRSMPRPAERLLRLADFLLAYVERHPDPDGGPELARAYRWIAAAYLRPGWAAAEMRQTIERTAADIGTPAELPAQAQQLQVAQLSAVLHAPLAAGLPAERYTDVLEASNILARYWYRGPAEVASELAREAATPSTSSALKVQVVTALRRVAAVGPGTAAAAAAGEQVSTPAPAPPPASEFERGPESKDIPEAVTEPAATKGGWGPELVALRDTLAELYGETVEARRVAEMAGLRATFIRFSPKSLETWYNILDLARVEGRVPDVLRVARADFPQNDALRALEQALVGPVEPPVEIRPMRLYLALSPRIVTGRTFLLGAVLREADSPPPTLDLPIAASQDVTVLWPPDVEWLTLRMGVASSSAVPNGEPVSYLRLRRSKEPAVAYFELTPKVPGPVELSLSLYQDKKVIGSVTAETTAEQADQPEAGGRADSPDEAALVAIMARLRDVLAKFYFDPQSVRRVLSDAGLSRVQIAQIPYSKTRSMEAWDAALRVARGAGRLGSLIEVATREFTSNTDLGRVATEYRKWVEQYGEPSPGQEPELARLEDPKLAALHDLFAGLYPQVSDVRRVAADAGFDPEQLRFAPTAYDSWHAILEEARREGKMRRLIGIVRKEYPDNQALAQAEQDLLEDAAGPQAAAAPQADEEPPVEGDLGKRPTDDFPDCCAAGDDSRFYGSGVLVAPQIVLTSRHMQDVSRVFLKGSDVTQLETGEVIKVVEQIVHPTDDIRALFLEHPASVVPRPVAVGVDDAPPAEALFVGFGTTDVQGTIDYGRKRYVRLPIASLGCDTADDAKRYGCQESRELVAGGQGRDSSSGDAGGPLYIAGSDGGYLLLATCSRAARGGTTTAGDGGIYVRIDRALDWLRSIAGNDPGHEIKTVRVTVMPDSKAA